MSDELFPMPEKSPRPLENWMADALKDCPPSDAEALARIACLSRRRECFSLVKNFRVHGARILADMSRIVRDAVARGVSPIGGVSLAGVLRLACDPPHEISNDAACVYAFVLGMVHPELSDHLDSDGENVKALRRAGWLP